MNLFKFGKFISTSGVELDFKIECDVLSNEDWDCISQLVLKMYPYRFSKVLGVPTGGQPLEDKLKSYETGLEDDPVLIVDDVWTTGNSMRDFVKDQGIIKWKGIVVFNRSMYLPTNVMSVFDLNISLTKPINR